MANPANIRLGGCTVTWQGVDLGYTIGGVALTLETTVRHNEIDHFGNGVEVSDRITSRKMGVQASFAEAVVSTLETIFASSPATISTSGTLGVQFDAGVLLNQGTLILHPVSMGDDLSEDILIPNAKMTGNIAWSYQVDTETTFQITWTSGPDANGYIFYFGGSADAGVSGDELQDVSLNAILDHAGNSIFTGVQLT